MSIFTSSKPEWFRQLPEYLQPHSSKIKEIENFKKCLGIDDFSLSMLISMTHWGVRRLQLFMLKKFRSESPTSNEKDLWKCVIISRMIAKSLNSDIPKPPYTNPLSQNEIDSIINNIDLIISQFNYFEEVVEYLIQIDEKEGWFNDPSGLNKDLNLILEN